MHTKLRYSRSAIQPEQNFGWQNFSKLMQTLLNGSASVWQATLSAMHFTCIQIKPSFSSHNLKSFASTLLFLWLAKNMPTIFRMRSAFCLALLNADLSSEYCKSFVVLLHSYLFLYMWFASYK